VRANRDGSPIVPSIALVTAEAALSLDEDLPPLVEALERARCARRDAMLGTIRPLSGARSTRRCCARPGITSSASTNFSRGRIAARARTRLYNPPELVEWNTDKHYLAHLHATGVEVVPSRFVEPGEATAASLDHFLTGQEGSVTAGHAVPFTQFVVKPSIGAGSRDAARYRCEDRDKALEHLVRLVDTKSAARCCSRTSSASTRTAKPRSCTSVASRVMRSAR
jgi:O-ureido-D-serine cyclo-ligase